MECSDNSQSPKGADKSGHSEQPEKNPTTPPALEAILETSLQIYEPENSTAILPQAMSSPGSIVPDEGGSGSREGRHANKDDYVSEISIPGAPAKPPTKFSDLPTEIREMIWPHAWCRRLVKPSIVICRVWHAFETTCALCRTRVRYAPARDPPAAFVNHEALECARRSAKPLNVWPLPWDHFRSLLNATRYHGPVNHGDVLNEALDPEAAIMVDMFIFYGCTTREEENRILNLLYHRYLKTRDHVYLEFDTYPLELSEEAWRQALEWDLLRKYEGQSHLVSLDDRDTLDKYLTLWQLARPDHRNIAMIRLSLLQKYTLMRLSRVYLSEAAPRWPPAWHRVEREGLTDLQIFMLRLVDFLMESHGIADVDSGRGEEIIGPDGRIMKDHPLVKQAQLRLPEFHVMVVFEVAARSRP
ncbi:hypothetical protein VP1G_08254 [Cytospora mali]|uniref:2EXR domain-containing protein n=1 Tax=Cytospora mali TaxID=578113 RepID=A0A194VB17_CYTMA|nr:hypothetical protein VP1G_08254 [Valsa mali var. pyri (nom. inval.)]